MSISSVKCIDNFFFGEGSFQNIKKIIEERQKLHKISGLSELFIFYFDAYFKNNSEIITKCKSINNVEVKRTNLKANRRGLKHLYQQPM